MRPTAYTVCHWTRTRERGYRTACGVAVWLEGRTVRELGFWVCPYCGGALWVSDSRAMIWQNVRSAPNVKWRTA